MKITRIETIPVRVPIKPALAIRGGRGLSHSVSPFLLVKVHTDEGIVGVGEASCTARWSGEDQVTAAHYVNTYFAPLLVGEMLTLDDVERVSAKFMAAVAGNYFTKACVEMALWDIVGKALDKPVWQLIAQRSRHTPCAVAVTAQGVCLLHSEPLRPVIPDHGSRIGPPRGDQHGNRVALPSRRDQRLDPSAIDMSLIRMKRLVVRGDGQTAG
jgi:L-alanine-DL-glutamate epimerase-like enolase superfamily enzyme